MSVILWADAIIQPSAVMIEFINASIALATMLWFILDMWFANFTIELKWWIVEIFTKWVKKREIPFSFCQALSIDSRICRIYFRCLYCIVHYTYYDNKINSSDNSRNRRRITESENINKVKSVSVYCEYDPRNDLKGMQWPFKPIFLYFFLDYLKLILGIIIVLFFFVRGVLLNGIEPLFLLRSWGFSYDSWFLLSWHLFKLIWIISLTFKFNKSKMEH